MPIRRPNLNRKEASGPEASDAPALAMHGFVTVRVVQLAEIIARGASQVFEQQFGVKNTELRILVQLAGELNDTHGDEAVHGQGRCVRRLGTRGFLAVKVRPADGHRIFRSASRGAGPI